MTAKEMQKHRSDSKKYLLQLEKAISAGKLTPVNFPAMPEKKDIERVSKEHGIKRPLLYITGPYNYEIFDKFKEGN